MDKIEIFWGADKDFDAAIDSLDNIHFLVDVISHINKTDLKIEGLGDHKEPPKKQQIGQLRKELTDLLFVAQLK